MRTVHYQVVLPCYQAVPQIGAISTRDHPKSTVSDGFQAIAAEVGRKKKREKNLESVDPSPATLASDFFSPRGEKERGDIFYLKFQFSLFLGTGGSTHQANVVALSKVVN
ncbi:hypothetical protein GW17_00005274 [Ensete ventricosum]|nr:hypothetical protein GW17_00005274 [Ensete ventricosum]RZR85155.1 hypothetical protein BHM03_00012105 [Ensete ventricosum]